MKLGLLIGAVLNWWLQAAQAIKFTESGDPSPFSLRSPPKPSCPNDTQVTENDVIQYLLQHRRTTFAARPLLSEKPIDVAITLFFYSVVEVSDRNMEVVLRANAMLEWFNEHLTWGDVSPLNCVWYLSLPTGPDFNVWVPNIAFVNSRDPYANMNDGYSSVRVLYNGYSSYSPIALFRFFCVMDLYLFPFDTQRCEMQFESWRFRTTKFRFVHVGCDASMANLADAQLWTLSVSCQNTANVYSSGNFSVATYQLIMKRRVQYYMVTAIFPSILLAVVELATFLLPYDEPVRLELSFTCLLSYYIFLLNITGDLPRTADTTPLLVTMISLLTAYIVVAILFQALCMTIANRARSKTEPPGWVRLVLRLSGQRAESLAYERQWRLFAQLLNTVGTWLFVGLIGCTLISLLLITPLANQAL